MAAMPAHAKTIVDLGAGQGVFAQLLRARGVDATCVEPDPSNERQLRRLGFAVYRSLTELEPGSIDYIYTLNVLEHVRDDETLAAAAFSRLRHGGRFFVFVPAFPILWSPLDDHVEHERRYRRGPLVQKLQRVGFAIEQARYADSLGFFAALAARASAAQMTRRNVAFYDRLLFPMSKSLDPILGRFFGKNLAVVCRRS